MRIRILHSACAHRDEGTLTPHTGRLRQDKGKSGSRACNRSLHKSGGGGFRMGNTYKSMADSCQCMAKTTTIL